MRKRIVLLACFFLSAFLLVIPERCTADFYVIPVSNSPLKGPKKSLCDFPYWQYGGSFQVYYDFKGYDPDYLNSQQPHGGIMFEFWLGKFASAAERDAVAVRISKVVFFNNDTGDSHEMTQAFKFDYVGAPSADYFMYLGHQLKVKGRWDMVVIAAGIKYAMSFTLTQEMLDRVRPIPVVPVVKSAAAGNFTVTAPLTNGDYYAFRIFDANYNILYNQVMVKNDPVGSVSITAPSQYAGSNAVIETRFNSGNDWLALRNSQTCDADGGIVGGGFARSATRFKIEEVP